MDPIEVSSSVIDQVIIDETDNTVVVRFNGDYADMWGFWGVKYHDNNAQSHLEGLTSGGAGAYFWSTMRGKTPGPSYFRGWKTPGGTHAGLIPYDYVGDPVAGIGVDYHMEIEMLRDGIEIKGYPWIAEMRGATPEARATMFVERIGLLSRMVQERREDLRKGAAQSFRAQLERL